MAITRTLLLFLAVVALSGCADSPTKPYEERTPLEWVEYTCNPENVPTLEKQRESIELIERRLGFTFKCPKRGEQAYIRWLDPRKAALARRAAEAVEKPEPITPELIAWINQVCARPPGPEREQSLDQIRARGIQANCPDRESSLP